MPQHPPHLRYHQEHMWVAEHAPGVFAIGITDFAQESLGPLTYLRLPDVGDEVTAGEPLGEAESAKALSDLVAPVSGRVVEVNGRVLDYPETVNEDPYETGWMVRIEVRGGLADYDLMAAGDYEAVVGL